MLTDSAAALPTRPAIQDCSQFRSCAVFADWNLIYFGFFLCALPFLGACTALAPGYKNETVSTIITEPMPDMASTQSPDFRLLGRVSVKGGRESFSGGVQWHHSGDVDDILLLSPLGQALAQIQRIPEGVFLTSPEEHHYADDVESLTEQVLGWRLPLAGLQYWVQGLSSPETSSAMDIDVHGRVVTIRQDGWEIDYANHPAPRAAQAGPGDGKRHVARKGARTIQDAGTGPATQDDKNQGTLPRMLTLRREGLQIKLVIDDWNFNSN